MGRWVQRRLGRCLGPAHRNTSGMDDVTVRRVDFGYFVRPPEETGTGEPRVEPCLGYLVVHPEGTLLFNTGMGGDPWVDQHYRPRRTGLAQALCSVDVSVDDIDLVANCHLHFDHCGGNAFFSGKPTFTQASELVAARAVVDYTLAELIDTPGTRCEELAGVPEVLPSHPDTDARRYRRASVTGCQKAGRHRGRCRTEPRHCHCVQH
jgi:glyoxylase-like metal-dependent hydrolase (beta-lactamase superfamily II)